MADANNLITELVARFLFSAQRTNKLILSFSWQFGSHVFILCITLYFKYVYVLMISFLVCFLTMGLWPCNTWLIDIWCLDLIFALVPIVSLLGRKMGRKPESFDSISRDSCHSLPLAAPTATHKDLLHIPICWKSCGAAEPLVALCSWVSFSMETM